jgi:hypothetical protein
VRVLSVDPGHSTGIAVFVRGEYVLSLNISDSAWNDPDLLTGLVRLVKPDVVLLEGIPTKQVDEKTAARFYELERWFTVVGYKVHVIQPSEWKGLTKRVEIPGQHARDAATMAAWWIEKEKS